VQVSNGIGVTDRPLLLLVGKVLDRVILFLIVGLILVAPFAAGSAPRTAYLTIELTTFVLAILSMAKLAIVGVRQRVPNFRRIALPAGFLTGLILLQVVPLPPGILVAISPSTYRLYAKSLPGWPTDLPYRQILDREKSSAETAGAWGLHSRENGRLRTVAISAPIARIGLFKLLSGMALFTLLLLYDFRTLAYEEESFYRAILVALIFCGLAVSVFAIVTLSGVVESPDSKTIIRATGPYQNADHLACLLSMILPFAIVGALFPTTIMRGRSSFLFPIFAGLAAVAISIALVLTISRAAWAATGLATILVLSWPSRLYSRFAAIGLDRPRIRAVCAIAILVGLFILVGSEARSNISSRAVETFTTVDERVGVWKDSLPMVRDFLLLGTGLGCWSEIFPRYQSPPWLNTAYWEATHNDYFELLTELGGLGLGLAIWLLLALAAPLRTGVRAVSEDLLPIVVAAVAAAVAVLFEEFFDFGLQVPANAIAFVVIVAIGIRLSLTSAENLGVQMVAVKRRWPIAIALVMVAISLLSLTQLKDRFGEARKSPLEARTAILADPASSDEHMLLLEMANSGLTDSEFERELKAVLWLQPSNPYVRDTYATILLRRGERAEGLSQIRTSVMVSPEIETHRYLGAISAFSDDEKKAVEEGFIAAIARGYANAVDELSYFYKTTGKMRKDADNYDAAAKRARLRSDKSVFFARAGEAYADAGDLVRAEEEFHNALQADPSSIESNEGMLRLLAREGNDDRAASLIKSAAENGTDTVPLYITAARVEASAGRLGPAEQFASAATDLRPYNREALMSLGQIYLAENKVSKAAATFERITDTDPKVAEAFYYLAISKDREYDYAGAEDAFQRAIALTPKDPRIQSAYQEFQRKIDLDRPSSRPPETGGVPPTESN
jgi:O-antigen ligase/predicted Zn-dependent protease